MLKIDGSNFIAFTKVRLPWGWLGNMAPYPVVYQDIRWPTTEHLFQALRFSATDDDGIRDAICAQKSPMSAKMFAKQHIGRWVVAPRTEADVAHMKMCLKLKLEQHPVLQSWLRDSGTATIIEDCSNRPNASGLFWGASCVALGEWEGQNVLGNLWMELRDAT